MLQVKTKRNPQYPKEGSEKIPRYFFELDLSEVMKGGSQATLPVFWRPNTSPHPLLKEVYSVEVAGIMVERGNLLALERVLPDTVQSLTNYGTLPYYFIDLPGWAKLPVYLVGKKLQTRLNDGLQLSGDDIGQLWRRLGDYLIGTKGIQDRDEIIVSLLFWKELRIYSPAFVFCNGKDRIWIPIFYRGESLNYDVIGQPSRLLPIAEAFDLRQEVAASLTASGRLSSLFELKMEQVPKEVWERLKKIVTASQWVLSYYIENSKTELPIFEAGGVLFAPRLSSRTKLTFGRDTEDLRQRTAEELVRERKISSASYLELERRR